MQKENPRKVAMEFDGCDCVTVTNNRVVNQQLLRAKNVDGLHIDRNEVVQIEVPSPPKKKFWEHPVAKGVGTIAGGVLVGYIVYRFGWN